MIGGAASDFFRSAGLMAATEMVNRIARIATVVVMARMLEVSEFALVALTLTVWELVRMVSHNGLGARVVAGRQDELAEVCAAVGRLNWGVGIGMFAIQCAVAWPIARAYDQPQAAIMLVALAFTYLLNPIVMTRAFLAQRIPGLRFAASSAAGLAAADNLLIAVLMLSGFGPWGAILPKIILAPFWIGAHLLWAPAVPDGGHGVQRFKSVFGFSFRVFVAEALSTFRQHADRLAIGRLFGMDALGHYAFAVNSGSGITQSLSTAVGNAILPFIARASDSCGARERFWTSVRVLAAGIVPVVAAQCLFADWYVPLIFGERWAPSAQLLSIVCLGSLARIFTVPMSQLLRAQGLAQVELQQSCVAAAFFMAALLAGAPFGVYGVAVGIVLAALLPLPLFVRWGLRAISARTASGQESASIQAGVRA